MSQHVFARLSGFGWTLLPLAPYRIEQVAGQPQAVTVEHDSRDGTRSATVSLAGEPTVQLGANTERLDMVLDLMEGPTWDHWRIETAVFTVRWPEGLLLQSNPTPPGFDLLGPEQTQIYVYVQGPILRSRLPALDAMAAPGQRVRRQGRSPRWSWVDLEYDHEGQPWRQKHHIVDLSGRVCLVTAQAPQAWFGPAEAAAGEVADSLEPFQE